MRVYLVGLARGGGLGEGSPTLIFKFVGGISSVVISGPSRSDLGEGRCDYQFASCIACEIHSSSHTALAATRAAAATVTTAAITAAAFSPTVVTRPSRARSDDTRSLKSHAPYNTSPAIGTHVTTVSPTNSGQARRPIERSTPLDVVCSPWRPP